MRSTYSKAAASLGVSGSQRMKRKPRILIGPVSDDPTESVSAVNRAFVGGVSDSYDIIQSRANRHFGSTKQSLFNFWNVIYLLKHGAYWVWNLVRWRPAIAHYAISSGWALKKGLCFLRLARYGGARTVGHLHSGGFLDFWESLSMERRESLLNEFMRLDAFIVLSERWKVRIAEKVGISPEKIFVVNNPIDEEFEATALSMPIERAAGHLLSLGTIGRDKGIFELLEAAKLIWDSKWQLALQLAGPEREPGVAAVVRLKVEEMGLVDTVSLEGSVWGDRKVALFRGASIFVLPSYYENFPLVLLEAAAAGMAIITTPVGATPEFFTHGESALFVDPGDSEQLADAVRRLLSCPEECRLLAQGARAVFREKLARSQIVNSLKCVYASLRPMGTSAGCVEDQVGRAR